MEILPTGREEVHHPRRLERDPVLGEGKVQLLHEALLRQHAPTLHPRLGPGNRKITKLFMLTYYKSGISI